MEASGHETCTELKKPFQMNWVQAVFFPSFQRAARDSVAPVVLSNCLPIASKCHCQVCSNACGLRGARSLGCWHPLQRQDHEHACWPLPSAQKGAVDLSTSQLPLHGTLPTGQRSTGSNMPIQPGTCARGRRVPESRRHARSFNWLYEQEPGSIQSMQVGAIKFTRVLAGAIMHSIQVFHDFLRTKKTSPFPHVAVSCTCFQSMSLHEPQSPVECWPGIQILPQMHNAA